MVWLDFKLLSRGSQRPLGLKLFEVVSNGLILFFVETQNFVSVQNMNYLLQSAHILAINTIDYQFFI